MNKLKLVSIIFIFTISFTTNLFAGGCNPGEPCWDPPKPAPEPAPPAVIPDTAMPPIQRLAPEQRRELYATIGGGWIFLEKDEEFLGHQIYEARIGAYRIRPHISVEASVGYLPDVRNREWPDPGRHRVDGDASGVRTSADVLFHLKSKDQVKNIDPYVSIGGGVVHYSKATRKGHTDAFAEAGVGAFIDVKKNVFIKPDYKVGVVGSDTEVNQRATIAVGSKF